MQFPILTFNLWSLERKFMAQRMKAVAKIIQDNNIQIACFQEVSEALLRWLKVYLPKYSFFAKERIFQDTVVIGYRRNQKDYDLTCEDFEWVRFEESSMGRGVLVGSFTCLPCNSDKTFRLLIATTHLESPRRHDRNQKLRRDQLCQAAIIIESKITDKNYDHVMLLGDLNWIPVKKFPLRIPNGWKDLWREKNGMRDGFTYDELLNPMIANNGKRTRLDRVLVKGSVEQMAIYILGKEPIPDLFYTPKWSKGKRKVPVLPSDHYALKCHLEF